MLRVPVVKGNLNKALKIFKKRFKKNGYFKKFKRKTTIYKKIFKKETIKKQGNTLSKIFK